jgi:transposase
MQDEYWTSQRCHACTSFLVDGPRHREKQCVTCDKVINRDLNAALNLQVLRSTS